LANFNGKEHLRHRAVSLRQHGFLVDNIFIIILSAVEYYLLLIHCRLRLFLNIDQSV